MQIQAIYNTTQSDYVCLLVIYKFPSRVWELVYDWDITLPAVIKPVVCKGNG